MFKQLIRRNIFIIFLLFCSFVLADNVSAASHKLEISAVICDSEKYNDETALNNYNACYNDYKDGLLDSYMLTDESEINAGTMIMAIVTYRVGDVAEVTGINTNVVIDPSIWEIGVNAKGSFFSKKDATQFTEENEDGYTSSWFNQLNLSTNSEGMNLITIVIDEQSGDGVAQETDAELGYFFLTLSDSASGDVSLKFSTAGGDNDMSDVDANSVPFTLSELNLTVPGESLSHDASLGTLSVSNSETVYSLSPNFVAGSTAQKNYKVVVPNDITYVNLNATANHSRALVASGGIGKKDLNVGNNTFPIVVTSAFGNTETYTVEVYRLSNDATLSSINLTNNISFGNIVDGQYSYETTIPYAIKDTTVSATTTHEKAYIDSGEGVWTLSNSGALSNNKTIVVKAENCLSEYSSVPGNTCSSQNYNLKIYREAASDNSYLKSLTVDSTLVSGFNKTIQEYDLGEVSYNTTSLLINGTVEDTGKATAEGFGTVNLKVGENEFTVKVTAEDLSTRNYKIKVYRLSNEANLSGLTITSDPQATMSPTFNETFYGDYTYKYDATVSDITISATAKDKDKAYVLIYDSATSDISSLTSSLNTQTQTFGIETKNVTVMVTAEDGTVKTYSIKLERAASTDSTLKSLTLSDGTLNPSFKSETKNYTATVPASITSVTVNAVPNSVYGKIKEIKGTTNLQFGSNTIEVVVEAEDKSTSSYFINLTREEYDIATLEDITIDGVSIKDFNRDTLTYTLEAVPFETTKIVVGTTKTNSYSTVSGDGEISLKTGINTIKILVTAQNGVDKNEYILIIERKKNGDNTISNLFVKGIEAVNTDVGIYEVTLPNSVTQLTPEDVVFDAPDDSEVSKTMTLTLSTKYVNDYQFTVTSESGEVQFYSIKVTRTKSNDSTISRVNLTIDEDSSRYCLMEGGTTCKIEVPVDTEEFSLDAVIHDEASINPVNGTTYEMPSTESTKNIKLTVTAEDETSTEYTVIVERQKSSNNNLKELNVDGSLVDGFTAGTQIYYVTVPGTQESVNVSAIVEDTGKASITTDLSEPFELNYGQNRIDVVVKSEEGNSKTYTIFITRSNRIDVSLSNLTINGVQIDGFESNKTEYTLDEVPYNTHQLNIVATPTDAPLATKAGDGLVSLKTGDNQIVITVTAHDTTITQDYIINVKRTLNSDKTIKKITLAGVEAIYNNTTKNYEVTVPNDIEEANNTNLVVDVNDAVTDYDKKAEYSFTTTPLLTTNINEIPITITAEDGTTKIYNLSVTREKAKIATLSSVTVTNGSFNPSFTSNKFEYDVTVPVDTTDFNVSAVLTDQNAKITSGTGNYTMTESTMKVKIVVVSEDLSETETYTLNINRTKSSVNTLSGITVSEGELSPEFNSNTTSYIVNVAGDVEKIDIQATLTDDRANITSGIGEHNLVVGENTITIRVVSESGAPLDYTIKVIRAQKSNNYLSSLTVDGVLIPDFDKEITEYTLEKVDYDKTSIEIGAVAEDSDAIVTGETGKVGLATGNNDFMITVTAQNGLVRTYTINIERAKNDDATLDLLTVAGYSSLVPAFESAIFDYIVTVDEYKTTLSPNEITAIPNDTNATVNKQEAISLSTTVDNFYKIEVIAEDGITKNNYTIQVIRPKSTDATLKSVNITGATITPEFKANKYEYTLIVPYGSTSGFTIEGVPNVDTTSVYGNGSYSKDNSVIELITRAEDANSSLTYKFNIVEAASNDATLSSLSVKGYPFDKTFEKTTLNYDIGDIPFSTTQLMIETTSTNSDSEIEYYVDGSKQSSNIVTIPQTLGEKTIAVKVIAADGVTTKTYNITYNVVNSSNAYLSKLSPSIGEIEFNKTTENYTLTVENSVTSIDFNIETEDENASVKVGEDSFFNQKIITLSDLSEGKTNLTVLVTAQDGKTTKTYNVLITRLAPVASDDANLSALSVNGYSITPEFNMETLEYSIGEIPFALTELTINATPNYGKSTVSYLVNGVGQSSNVVSIPRVDGTGAVTVKVLAEDRKTVKNYKITYTKQASGNAYLSNIVVSNGTLVFDKKTFEYNISVDSSVNSFDITAITEDATAVMQMNGTAYTSPHTLTISPLNAGKTETTIMVTAESGNVVTYKVIVDREADPSSIITSEKYGHTITNGYIKTVNLNVTGIELKDQLDNPNEYLEIWSSDETRLISDSEKLATGMIVKLMIDGVEHDRKVIVIKGDTNGDGIIDLFDAVKILNHYLERTILTGAYQEAAYANEDSNIDLFDAVKILNHYLERDLLH